MSRHFPGLFTVPMPALVVFLLFSGIVPQLKVWHFSTHSSCRLLLGPLSTGHGMSKNVNPFLMSLGEETNSSSFCDVESAADCFQSMRRISVKGIPCLKAEGSISAELWHQAGDKENTSCWRLSSFGLLITCGKVFVLGETDKHMAVGQNLRYLFGVGYHPTIVFLKGFWDVH